MTTPNMDVEESLTTVHQEIAKLKNYVNSKLPDASAEESTHSKVFDTFMLYVRSTVLSAMQGTLVFLPPRSEKKQGPMKIDYDANVRTLLNLTVDELSKERQEKQLVQVELSRFNRLMEQLQYDNNHLQVYKDRIVELQAVINGVKKPGDISQEIGPPPTSTVPADAVPTAEQKKKEVVNELARLTTLLRDKLRRTEADLIRVDSEKVSLVGENAMLADRVRVLEAQLAVLTSSSSVALRELEKQRVHNAKMVEQKNGPRMAGEKLKPGECVVGGTVMEKEVALWLREMYQLLLHDPDSSQTLLALRDRPDSPSGTLQSASSVSRPARPSSTPNPNVYGQGRGEFKDFVSSIEQNNASL